MWTRNMLAGRFPAILDAIESEWPDGVAETVGDIQTIKTLKSTTDGSFLYSVICRGGDDFWVIEGQTGTGVYYQNEEDANHDWNL